MSMSSMVITALQLASELDLNIVILSLVLLLPLVFSLVVVQVMS